MVRALGSDVQKAEVAWAHEQLFGPRSSVFERCGTGVRAHILESIFQEYKVREQMFAQLVRTVFSVDASVQGVER